jgi:molecular chaperone DnaJ
MAQKDYYEILGLGRDASQDEIKKAYRILARKYHPDVNPEDKRAEDKFKEVKEAYDVLNDPQKRQYYDQFGHTGGETFGGGFGGFGDFSGFGGFGDIFETFFGGGFTGGSGRQGAHNAPQRGNDLRYDLEITLEEVVKGKETTIVLPRHETCAACSGTGARADGVETCQVCGGTGRQQVVRNTSFGRFVNVKSCEACAGTGKIIREKCPECNGQGTVFRERKIELKIPAGVDSESRLRVAGGGRSRVKGRPPGGSLRIYSCSETCGIQPAG